MDDILDDIARSADRCEWAARLFDSEPVQALSKRLIEVAESLGEAWSGSWIGYHSNLYTKDLLPPLATERFNVEWGPQEGVWFKYEYQSIEKEILARAGVSDLALIKDVVKAAKEAFDNSQQELLPTLDALLSVHDDAVLRDLRKKIEQQPNCVSRSTILQTKTPQNFFSRDSLAMSQLAQGVETPQHIAFDVWLLEQQSFKLGVTEMAKLARHAERYLKQKYKMKGQSVAKTDGNIFIGHGRSAVWRDLKDFIKDNLELDYDEFNREPTAGLGTTERLEAMLDGASFGFLVMTAEDEHADDTLHARENVVHEVGLFQGRLGFRRAIVLLEDGCKEFSNIVGLGHIRFPKGDIMAKSEDIRRVLKREGILK